MLVPMNDEAYAACRPTMSIKVNRSKGKSKYIDRKYDLATKSNLYYTDLMRYPEAQVKKANTV